jgi:glycosyltransferase involved in cell wall biosynthesis
MSNGDGAGKVPGGLTALVLTPFASHPADAGHRRRVLQTTRVLRDAGYRITFLFYAFEGAWYWRFDDAAFKEMAEEWGEVQVVMAHKKVGAPPSDGHAHHLDEWWDPQLEAYLTRLFEARAFDVMVVHNVWLSKAFDFAPPLTLKFLETHDVFWKRGALYRRIGMPMDFFTPTRDGEYFGLNRADVVIAVTEEELEEIRPHLTKPAFCIPTYAPQGRLRRKPQGDYLHEDRVVFGMLGTGHVFNVSGLQRLLDALAPRIARSFAPVDIVVAGDVGSAVTTPLPVKQLGYVAEEADFFEQVDFVLAPLFEGSGFKVKVADAVIFGKPIISSDHAAIGTDLGASCCDPTPEAMAERLVRIAIERPALQDYAILADEASAKMAKRANESHALLAAMFRHVRTAMIFDLSGLDPHRDFATIMAYASYLRPVGRFTRLFVAPPKKLLNVFQKNRFATTTVISADEIAEAQAAFSSVLWVRPATVESAAAPEGCLLDLRWLGPAMRRLRNEKVSIESIIDLPIAHPDTLWSPVAMGLRKWATQELAKTPRPSKLIFAPGFEYEMRFSPDADLGATQYLNCEDEGSFSLGVMHIAQLDAGDLEVVWTGEPDDVRANQLAELCTMLGRRYTGAYWGGHHLSSPPNDTYDTLSYVLDLCLAPLIRNA